MMTEQRTFVMKGVTWANSVLSIALTMMTEQMTFVVNGVTWANSDTCTALTMMIEQGTSVMKGVTWANSVLSIALTMMTLSPSLRITCKNQFTCNYISFYMLLRVITCNVTDLTCK